MDTKDIDLLKMQEATGLSAKRLSQILEQEEFDETPKSLSFEEAREEYISCKVGCVKKIKTLIHWICLAKTLDQLEEVFGHTISGTYEEQMVVIKMTYFFRK